jgi:hypothetical protein
VSSFTEPLILEALATTRQGRGEFLVHKPFRYEVGRLGSGDTITVPAGYNTDLCSVPWFARAFIPLAGKVAKPALLHDWLLDQGDARAHDVFEEAMKVAGVSPFKRLLLGKAVRLYAAAKRLFSA